MANISSKGKVKSGMTAAELRKLHFRIGKDFGLVTMLYNQALVNYTKFIVVRHPLERLISAYRDKMQGKDVTFRNAVQEVIARFRRNETDTAEYPTFREFVQMVLSKGILSINPHWDNYFFDCDVCSVKYDYILKIETMEHDLKMFLSSVYLNEVKYVTEYKLNSFRPPVELSDKPFSQYLNYFEELSSEEIQGLSSKFQYESNFYGYSFNQKTLHAECCDKDIIENNSSNWCCC